MKERAVYRVMLSKNCLGDNDIASSNTTSIQLVRQPVFCILRIVPNLGTNIFGIRNRRTVSIDLGSIFPRPCQSFGCRGISSYFPSRASFCHSVLHESEPQSVAFRGVCRLLIRDHEWRVEELVIYWACEKHARVWSVFYVAIQE